MTTYLFLAEGFEEMEAISPIDILRRANVDLITVSIGTTLEVTGAHGIIVKADNLFEEIDFSNNEMLILPGGMPGTKKLELHKGLEKLLLQQFKDNKFIATICAAPSILGKLGMLKSKEAICYPGFESYLFDAILSSKSVVQSENFITAKGAGVAIEFALKIVSCLKGENIANNISSSICY